MRGLRTKENEKFMRYFALVQEEAGRIGKVFFLDFGQCDDIQYRDIGMDTLFGWLISEENAATFEKLFLDGSIPESWNSDCCWVIPKTTGEKLEILFE